MKALFYQICFVQVKLNRKHFTFIYDQHSLMRLSKYGSFQISMGDVKRDNVIVLDIQILLDETLLLNLALILIQPF